MGPLPISTVLPREIDQRGEATQVVLFVDHGDHCDVWRVLHGQRDIPAWIGAADEG
jgi:plasmid stabilization system protein ParE